MSSSTSQPLHPFRQPVNPPLTAGPGGRGQTIAAHIHCFVTQSTNIGGGQLIFFLSAIHKMFEQSATTFKI
jgi:hypothetical protein